MNIKLRDVILAVAVVGYGSIALGKPISPDQAIERTKSSVHKLTYNRNFNPTLVETISDGRIPAVYIFQYVDGMIFLSADDEITPLLGYSNSYCASDNLPPACRLWLETISKEISMVRSGERYSKNRGGDDFTPIAPMCKTEWNQNAPYNNRCPKNVAEGKKCYTGCVATAMAQVMKYHSWPPSGEGDVSYYTNLGSGNFNLKLDFSKQVYDWANMLDKYVDGEYTEAEADAVAFLMKSCGFSVEMNYSSSGSGALSPRIGPAFGKHFKYDRSKLRYMMRDYFSLDEWENMIYSSLQNDGPVILNGQSNEGGHSFVCDGYDKDGYFHINWGWGGVSDGYYLLSVLDPYNQGIGGSGDNSGFNFMQDAILGITPAKNIENGPDSWIGQMYARGYLGVSTNRTYTLGEEIEGLCKDGFYNYGPGPLPDDMVFGLLFRSETTGECYATLAAVGEAIDVLYGFADFALPLPTDIPDGEYQMTLSYYSQSYLDSKSAGKQQARPDSPNEPPRQESDEPEDEMPTEGWINVYFPMGVPDCYTAVVSNGEIRFEESPRNPSKVSEVDIDAPVKYYNLQGIEIKAPAPGEVVVAVKGRKVYKTVWR